MGAQFTIPLITVIPGQLISASLWNNEFDNLNTNFVPAGMDSYSDSDSQMRIQTNPFPGSVTSHATSLGGEIERIRYQIAQILGTTYWYQPAQSGNNLSNVFVTGEIRPFAGSTIPTGFLDCDGSAVSQVTYAALYAVIGTTWNTGGEGSGNFRIPDLRGRALLGAGTGSGLTGRSLGQSGGEETHLLVTGEMPVHAHSVTDPAHTHSVADHAHNITDIQRTQNNLLGWDTNLTGPNGVGISGIGGLNVGGTSGFAPVSAIANASIAPASHTTGISIQNSGGDGTHNNMQPWACVHYIIKT